MGDEQLIDLVRRYEAIYNIKCIEYRDATLRNAAWEEIAKLHGKPSKYLPAFIFFLYLTYFYYEQYCFINVQPQKNNSDMV